MSNATQFDIAGLIGSILCEIELDAVRRQSRLPHLRRDACIFKKFSWFLTTFMTTGTLIQRKDANGPMALTREDVTQLAVQCRERDGLGFDPRKVSREVRSV